MKTSNPSPFQDRDLHTILRFPTLSWSSISCFRDYDKDEWYEKYVLGIRSEGNSAMAFGTFVGEKLATDPTFMPDVPKPEVYELELKGKIGNIDIIGHLDGWSPSVLILDEFKTSCNPNRWTQEKVDTWGQLTFYCLLLWLNHKIQPDKIRIRLTAIIGQEAEDSFDISLTDTFYVFETKRTMKDLLKFGGEIKLIHTQMQKFIATKENMR